MIDAVRKQIIKAKHQVRQSFLGVVARGGSKKLQLKGFADEVLQDTEVFQQVGLATYIPENARVVVLPLQGKTSKAIVLATDGGNITINVSEGETCIYDQFGHSVWLKKEGTFVEGDLFVNGKIEAKAEVLDQKGSMQQIRDTYNQHLNGSTTSTPTPQM